MKDNQRLPVYVYHPNENVVREKPRMEKPTMRYSEDSNGMKYIDPYQKNLQKEAMGHYEKHLASLKEYPAQGFGPEHEGKELVEGRDFKLLFTLVSDWALITGNPDDSLTEQVAIPMKVKPSWWHDRTCPETNKKCVVGFCRGACSYQEVDKHKPKEGWPVVPLTELNHHFTYGEFLKDLCEKNNLQCLQDVINYFEERKKGIGDFIDTLLPSTPHEAEKQGDDSELWEQVEETIRLSIGLDPYRSNKIVDYLKDKFHLTTKTNSKLPTSNCGSVDGWLIDQSKDKPVGEGYSYEEVVELINEYYNAKQ